MFLALLVLKDLVDGPGIISFFSEYEGDGAGVASASELECGPLLLFPFWSMLC
jgi:hypothetical protein